MVNAVKNQRQIAGARTHKYVYDWEMIYFILIYKWHLLPSLKDTKSIFLVKSMKTHLIIKLNYLNHLRIQFYLKTRIWKIQNRNKVIKDRYKCVTDWICKAPLSPRCAYQVRYTRLYQMKWQFIYFTCFFVHGPYKAPNQIGGHDYHQIWRVQTPVYLIRVHWGPTRCIFLTLWLTCADPGRPRKIFLNFGIYLDMF